LHGHAGANKGGDREKSRGKGRGQGGGTGGGGGGGPRKFFKTLPPPGDDLGKGGKKNLYGWGKKKTRGPRTRDLLGFGRFGETGGGGEKKTRLIPVEIFTLGLIFPILVKKVFGFKKDRKKN